MRVVVSGGTGFIGKQLVPALLERGDEVIVLTRRAGRAQDVLGAGVEPVEWTPLAAGPWQRAMDDADAVIHLAGKGVLDDRWSDRVKADIISSRVTSTELIVDAIRQVPRKPGVFLSGSAVGYYGDRADRVTETAVSGPDDDFLADVCRRWEAASHPASELNVRTVQLRTGVVLGRDSGAFPQLVGPMKAYIGGHLGSGQQPFPWVHVADVVGMMLWALDEVAVTGPLNLTAPEPPSMADFMTALGEALGRPSWMHAPEFAVRALLGERADMLLGGQNAHPAKALELGYHFLYPDLGSALASLVK